MEESNNPLRHAKNLEIEIEELGDFLADGDLEVALQYFEELEEVFHKIRRFPEGYPFLWSYTRRCHFARLPCLVIYAAKEEATVVLTVAHEHESPDRIAERLAEKLEDPESD